MEVNLEDNIYNEYTALMEFDGSYNLNDDIDEILRYTDSHFPSVFDFEKCPAFAMDNCQLDVLTRELAENGEINYSLPSLSTSNYSPAVTPICQNVHRPYSVSSVDGELFNAQEINNFLNDDEKMSESVASHCINTTVLDIPSRNTPSPAGSYTSSDGSWSSGVVSDASSAMSATEIFAEINPILQKNNYQEDTYSTEALFKSKTSPKVMVMESSATPFEVLEPVKEVNLLTFKAKSERFDSSEYNPQTVVKIDEHKIVLKNQSQITSQTCKASAIDKATKAIPSLPNSKPKTIFLSSNDFKALMQRMNSVGNAGNSSSQLVNGQQPKVIMKAANNKVESGNKIGLSKLVKTNGTLAVKQDSNKLLSSGGVTRTKKSNHINLTAEASPFFVRKAKSFTSSAINLNMIKGIIDEKMLKKQQRMIKNRESASLSRKKKKGVCCSA